MESVHPYTLLQFYVEAGADEAIGNTSLDRFKVLEKTDGVSVLSNSTSVIPFAPVVEKQKTEVITHEALSDARSLASSAQSLDDLRAAIDRFQALTIKRTATQMVFADGAPTAKIMLIGEAPEEDEDRTGRPFMGLPGQLLDKMLAAIGLSREKDVYITNILNWRPPANRAPSDAEIALSLPFIQRHIELVQPRLIILLGGVATKALLQTNLGITRLRGKFVDFSLPGLKAPVPLMPMFHPAYLLRSPQHKSFAWADLLAVKKKIEGLTDSI